MSDVTKRSAASTIATANESLMTSESPLETIKKRQEAWAKRMQHALDKNGYCGCCADDVSVRRRPS
jgi:hypothetical protein